MEGEVKPKFVLFYPGPTVKEVIADYGTHWELKGLKARAHKARCSTKVYNTAVEASEKNAALIKAGEANARRE